MRTPAAALPSHPRRHRTSRPASLPPLQVPGVGGIHLLLADRGIHWFQTHARIHEGANLQVSAAACWQGSCHRTGHPPPPHPPCSCQHLPTHMQPAQGYPHNQTPARRAAVTSTPAAITPPPPPRAPPPPTCSLLHKTAGGEPLSHADYHGLSAAGMYPSPAALGQLNGRASDAPGAMLQPLPPPASNQPATFEEAELACIGIGPTHLVAAAGGRAGTGISQPRPSHPVTLSAWPPTGACRCPRLLTQPG
jgi:hypothetical protein